MGPTWPPPGNSSEGLRAPGLSHREAGGLTVTELGSVPLPGSLCSLSHAGRSHEEIRDEPRGWGHRPNAPDSPVRS